MRALSSNPVTDKIRKIMGGEIKGLFLDLNDEKSKANSSYRILQTNEPQFSESLVDSVTSVVSEKAIRAIQKITSIKSIAEYPIFIRGDLFGTLTFYVRSKKIDELDESIKRLFSTYSLQIGIALENAHLYTQSQKDQRDLENALHDLKEIRRRERDMIDVMGHELRTPITIVRNALHVLDSDFKNNNGVITEEKLGKYLEMGIESTRREMSLIETMLAATKIEGNRIQLSLTKIDMLDVINDSLEAHKHTAKSKGLKMIYNPPADKEFFSFADRVRTQEVMDNLLGNSVKYTAKGQIEITIKEEKNMCRIDIKDTGVGIGKYDLEKLGKKFFRAKQLMQDESTEVHPGGTGLGLYVTFELINIMNGKKWIESEPGKGSTFSFALPLFAGQKNKEYDQTFMEDEEKDTERNSRTDTIIDSSDIEEDKN